MSKRFGRNQRRKAREQVAHLSQQLEAEKWAVRTLKNQLSSGKEGVFQEFLRQQGILERAVMEISHEIGKSLGAELEPHARKLLQCRRSEVPDFSYASSPVSRDYKIVEGYVPAFNFAVRIL